MKVIKRLLFFTLASLFCWTLVFGQAPVAKPDLLESAWHVTVYGAYSNVQQAMTNNGFETSADIRLGQHWAARLDYFTVAAPSSKTVLGKAQYMFSAKHLFKGSSQFDPSKLEFFVNGGMGGSHVEPCPSAAFPDLATCKASVEASAPPKIHFAFGAGGGINFKVNDMLVLRPVEVNYIHGAVGSQFVGNYKQILTGIGLRF